MSPSRYASWVIVNPACVSFTTPVWISSRVLNADWYRRDAVVTSARLALDQSHHRLFDGVRDPAKLIVLDTESGKQVSQVEGVSGIDDLWYDASHKRVYASGGRGFEVGSVYVYQQKDPDHYELIGKVPTAPGAGTSFWSPQLNRLYVAAPSNDKEEAAILVFEPQP